MRKVFNVAALFLLLRFLSMGSASAGVNPWHHHRIGYDKYGIWSHNSNWRSWIR